MIWTTNHAVPRYRAMSPIDTTIPIGWGSGITSPSGVSTSSSVIR
jgi:hypothetical protein